MENFTDFDKNNDGVLSIDEFRESTEAESKNINSETSTEPGWKNILTYFF